MTIMVFQAYQVLPKVKSKMESALSIFFFYIANLIGHGRLKIMIGL